MDRNSELKRSWRSRASEGKERQRVDGGAAAAAFGGAAAGGAETPCEIRGELHAERSQLQISEERRRSVTADLPRTSEIMTMEKRIKQMQGDLDSMRTQNEEAESRAAHVPRLESKISSLRGKLMAQEESCGVLAEQIDELHMELAPALRLQKQLDDALDELTKASARIRLLWMG